MDDLLKAFQAEISQDLDACEADLERLRKAPDGAASVANLHRLFCSIREMSVVLGQRKLADAASCGVSALDVAQAGEPGATARAIPIVAECLAQIRTLLQSIEHSDTTEASNRALPSNGRSAGDGDDHSASAAMPSAAPAKRSKSDAFDLIGEHDEAALPPLTAERDPPAPVPDARQARFAGDRGRAADPGRRGGRRCRRGTRRPRPAREGALVPAAQCSVRERQLAPRRCRRRHHRPGVRRSQRISRHLRADDPIGDRSRRDHRQCRFRPLAQPDGRARRREARKCGRGLAAADGGGGAGRGADGADTAVPRRVRRQALHPARRRHPFGGRSQGASELDVHRRRRRRGDRRRDGAAAIRPADDRGLRRSPIATAPPARPRPSSSSTSRPGPPARPRCSMSTSIRSSMGRRSGSPARSAG